MRELNLICKPSPKKAPEIEFHYIAKKRPLKLISEFLDKVTDKEFNFRAG